MNKTISIIMVTLNSELTIRPSLDSIRKQNYDQKQIEILVIDDGSKDKTKEIARSYGCKIIHNGRLNPEYGKYLGIKNATGKLIMFLDSDESLEDKDSIKKRVNAFSLDKNLKILFSGGFKPPKNSSLANKYVSVFADPFSYFVYGISPDSGFFLNEYKKLYPQYKDYKDFDVFKLSKTSPLPLLDTAGGTTIDKMFLKKVFPEVFEDSTLISQVTYKLMRNSGSLAVLKNDATIHDSVNTLKRYLGKLRWKIKVSVFFADNPSNGFAKREKYQTNSFNLRKYLFLPFAFSIIGPTAVGLYFSLVRRRLAGVLHPFLTFYVAFFIVYFYSLKTLGVVPKLSVYPRASMKKS